MRGGLVLVGIGIVLGLLGTAALAPLLGNLVSELSAFDPAVISLATGAMFLAAAIAAYVPARRVLKLDAIEVLRGD